MAIHRTAAAANQARVKADLDIAPLLLPEKPVLSLSDRTTRAVGIKAYRFRQSKSGARPPVAHAVISPPAARMRATAPAVSSKATTMWWGVGVRAHRLVRASQDRRSLRSGRASTRAAAGAARGTRRGTPSSSRAALAAHTAC